jgi:hypothetical protein
MFQRNYVNMHYCQLIPKIDSCCAGNHKHRIRFKEPNPSLYVILENGETGLKNRIYHKVITFFQ